MRFGKIMHIPAYSKIALRYGIALALGALILQWMETQYSVRMFTTELYIVTLALLFAGIGIWLGNRLSRQSSRSPFETNEQAIEALGLTKRQMRVLELLAGGGTNQEIAKQLFVSNSTVKTHLVHLYQKLDVSRRTQAVQKARSLGIIQ